MTARKVAIMLAIAALTGLTLFVISLIDGEAFGAVTSSGSDASALPDTLAFLHERITVGPDGDAVVEVTAVLGRGVAGDLLLPFDFEDGRDLAVLSGPARFPRDDGGAASPLREVLGRTYLNLETSPSASAGDSVVVRAAVGGWFDRGGARRDYGEYSLAIGYVNTSRFVFRDFSLELVLPEGLLVHSVTDVAPPHDPKKNPEPPYAIGREADHGWAGLRLADFSPAETCRLALRVRPTRRGPIPLVVGLAAALLYLVFFRDVLKPEPRESA